MNQLPTNPLLDPRLLLQLQRDCVAQWHQGHLEHNYAAGLGLVADQHAFNFQLWHEEDQARSPNAPDGAIAAVKRRIDRLNQQRHDAIERLDDWIAERLASLQLETHRDSSAELPQNTETPGSVIDRLSIVALRIYHLHEQLERAEIDGGLRASVGQKLGICFEQQQDLTLGLSRLLDDLCQGRKRHKTYRQFKMYNDPNLNPVIYRDGKGMP